jgi:hypothetical protein
MPGGGRSNVRWRTRITAGQSSFGPGLLFVKKLSGILVRRPKCGNQGGAWYREFDSPVSAGGHYRRFVVSGG